MVHLQLLLLGESTKMITRIFHQIPWTSSWQDLTFCVTVRLSTFVFYLLIALQNIDALPMVFGYMNVQFRSYSFGTSGCSIFWNLWFPLLFTMTQVPRKVPNAKEISCIYFIQLGKLSKWFLNNDVQMSSVI